MINQQLIDLLGVETAQFITEIQAARVATTPGPWVVDDQPYRAAVKAEIDGGDCPVDIAWADTYEEHDEQVLADLAWIVASHDRDERWLVEEVIRRAEKVAQVEKAAAATERVAQAAMAYWWSEMEGFVLDSGKTRAEIRSEMSNAIYELREQRGLSGVDVGTFEISDYDQG